MIPSETGFLVPTKIGVANDPFLGEMLTWSQGDEEWKAVPSANVLEDFVELVRPEGELDARDAVTFARRYGVLELCEHGEPYTHPHNPSCRISRAEPIARWEHFARQAASIHRLAQAVSSGGEGQHDDWELIAPGASLNTDVKRKVALAAKISWWLRVGRVTPVFGWTDDGNPDVTLSATGVFGAVARQLTFSAGRQEGLAVCYSCGRVFLPTRTPRVIDGRQDRTFCQDCRAKGAPKRIANREYMRRRRNEDGS